MDMQAAPASAGATTPRTMPGPKSFGLIDTVRFLMNPREQMLRITREYGDTFAAPDPKAPVMFTGNPEAIKTVFTADPDTFDIPLRQQLAVFVGETSLLQTTGARHKQDRKLLAPPFHGARMRAYGKTIIEIAQNAATRWTEGRPFVMLDVTQSISLEVILRAVFGVEDDARRAQFREAVVALMSAMASPAITLFEFTRREFGGLGPWARFRKARARFDALVYEEIAARRESLEAREDILSLMMSARYDDGSAMSDAELRDQLHLLLFAGHDTTSTALAWAFYWLAQQPEELSRMLAEIDGLGENPEPEALAALPYLEAVCQETLRIHPIAINVGRLLKRPLDVMGFTVPAGTTVMISALMLHNREDLYPEPHVFRPERFLERKFSPFEFVAFGGGPRRCLGAAFAMYEMKLVLATLLRKCRLRLVSNKPVKPVIRGLTMGPKGGIPMVLEGAR